MCVRVRAQNPSDLPRFYDRFDELQSLALLKMQILGRKLVISYECRRKGNTDLLSDLQTLSCIP